MFQELRNYIRFCCKFRQPTICYDCAEGLAANFVYKRRCYTALLVPAQKSFYVGGVIPCYVSVAEFAVYKVSLLHPSVLGEPIYKRQYEHDHCVNDPEVILGDIENFKQNFIPMKIFLTKNFPPAPYAAINLCGLLFCREKYVRRIAGTAEEGNFLRHEYTHTLQYREMLYLFFLIWYLIEYIVKYVICYLKSYRVYNGSTQRTTYRSISFEQEAYANQQDVQYNKSRKHYAWLRYVFKLYKVN